MPIAYTNRKNVTYYLHRGLAKSGRWRYFFSLKDQGDLVNKIPDGFEVRESPNGIVSLAKRRWIRILDSEIQIVQDALDRRSQEVNCRLDVKPASVTVFRWVGSTADMQVDNFNKSGLQVVPDKVEQMREMLDWDARFEPVLRFELEGDEARTFNAERMI